MYSHKIVADLTPYLRTALVQQAFGAGNRPNQGAARPGMQMPQNMGVFGGQGMRIG